MSDNSHLNALITPAADYTVLHHDVRNQQLQ